MGPIRARNRAAFERRRGGSRAVQNALNRGGEYDESEHPRDELGRWTDKGGGEGGGGAATSSSSASTSSAKGSTSRPKTGGARPGQGSPTGFVSPNVATGMT